MFARKKEIKEEGIEFDEIQPRINEDVDKDDEADDGQGGDRIENAEQARGLDSLHSGTPAKNTGKNAIENEYVTGQSASKSLHDVELEKVDGEQPPKTQSYESKYAPNQSRDEESPPNPYFEKFQYFLKFCMCILSLVNGCIDVAYIADAFYTMQVMYVFCLLFVVARYLAVLLLGQYYYHVYVRKFEFKLEMQAEQINIDTIDDRALEQKGSEHSKLLDRTGKMFYISLQFMYITGFYHILPVKDFSKQLVFGYLIEVGFQIIALLVCFTLNNVFTVAALSPIQSKAVFFKFCYALLFIAEIMVVWCQHHFNQRRSGPAYTPLNENMRRQQWSTRAVALAIVSMIFYIVLVSDTGILRGLPRVGLETMSLVERKCDQCDTDNCCKCRFSDDGCQKCNPGFALNGKTCEACNSTHANCLECEVVSSKKMCTKCKPGFLRGEDGTCVSCQQANCEHCKYAADGSKVCFECSPFHQLSKSGACRRCTDPNCMKCSSSLNKCDKCDAKVAELSSAGTCETCNTQNGYVRAQGRCVCNKDYKTKDQACRSCSELLPGCQKCELHQRRFPNSQQVDIGNGNYVTCVSCGHEMLLHQEMKVCQRCQDKIPGCLACTAGFASCSRCTAGTFVDKSGTCTHCRHHDRYCDTCSDTECNDCVRGYWNTYVRFGCIRRWF